MARKTEPGSAAEGFLLRRVKSELGRSGIEVCSLLLDEDSDTPSCTFFPEGTSAFAVAEKLIELLDRDDREPAGLTSGRESLA